MNHERRPPEPTEPLPSRAVPPQGPYGATAPIRKAGISSRRRRPGIPGRLVAIAAAALAAAFALGFYVGNAGEDPAPAEPAAEGAQQPTGGGGKCRRRALTQSSRVIAVQQQALANRTEFTRAALAGDQERLVVLNEALEPLSAQLQQLQSKLAATLAKCGPGGGGGGNDGGGG